MTGLLAGHCKLNKPQQRRPSRRSDLHILPRKGRNSGARFMLLPEAGRSKSPVNFFINEPMKAEVEAMKSRFSSVSIWSSSQQTILVGCSDCLGAGSIINLNVTFC